MGEHFNLTTQQANATTNVYVEFNYKITSHAVAGTNKTKVIKGDHIYN